MTTTTDLSRTAPFTHQQALALQAEELAITLALLRSLDHQQWATTVPDCPAWDVRAMYLHVLGVRRGGDARDGPPDEGGNAGRSGKVARWRPTCPRCRWPTASR